jgi:signal transduction histidine kinase
VLKLEVLMILQPRNHISVASIALFLGGLLWIAAFWLPVFETEQRDIAGYWIFLTGWMGFVVFQFAWYANLLLLMAVILMYSAPVKATVFAALGLLIATQAFWFDVLPETTKSIEIIGRGPGFWLWYAGIFLMSIGVFFCSDTDEVKEVTEVAAIEQDVYAPPAQAQTAETNKGTDASAEQEPAVPAQALAGSETEPEEKPKPAPAPAGPELKPKPVAETENVSLLAQLESVRKARQKVLAQQEKAKLLREAEQKQALLIEEEADERMESTLPALKAILSNALFSGNEKAGSQLPAFLLHSEDKTSKT